MKKILVFVLCFVVFASFANAETDLSNLTMKELRELQNQIEEEIKTRNVDKMDFTQLENEELVQVIFRAFQELCSREDFVENNVRSTGNMERLLFQGVYVVFKTVKGGWYEISIDKNNFDLVYMTSLEKIMNEAANIQIGK